MNNIATASSIPTQDDRIMAAVSHVAALLPLMGIIVPVVVWVTQKEKSKYIAFQSLQALAYQLIMLLAYFVSMGCYMASFFSMFLTAPITGGSDGNALVGLMFMIPFLVFGLIMLGGVVFVVYALIGAVMVLQGKDFRYVILGNRLERYLQKG